jgi:quercetin dioxygenase-like cupin family protein
LRTTASCLCAAINERSYDEQNIILGSAISHNGHADGSTAHRQPGATGRGNALTSKDLPEFPGKEVLMFTVEYPPGSVDPIHRHNAHAFVYVLEGSIIMQVRGGKEVTLTAGQTFYEGPEDIHVVGRNASSTKPAKFVVFLIKDKGAPVLVPVPE